MIKSTTVAESRLFTETDLPPDISAWLGAGERLLWIGQPHPLAYAFRGMEAWLYGLTWAVLGSFWYRGSGGVGSSSVFEGWWRLMPLGSLPFIVVGLSLCWRPVELARRARRTWYLITEKRVLLVEQISARQAAREHLPHAFRVTDFESGSTATPRRKSQWYGLHHLVFNRLSQANYQILPALEAGFFGLTSPMCEAVLATLARHPLYQPPEKSRG